jgi:hypothetical protein
MLCTVQYGVVVSFQGKEAGWVLRSDKGLVEWEDEAEA